MTADDLRQSLGLVPLEPEGGWFAETYRAGSTVPVVDGAGAGATRSLASAIYYLLTPATFSALHRLRSDELFHFYLGDPVELIQLLPGGEGRLQVLGTDLAAGMRPQLLVPRGVWQGARLRAGGALALLGTTMAPGFDPADFELGVRSELEAAYPAFQEWVRALTRQAARHPTTG